MRRPRPAAAPFIAFAIALVTARMRERFQLELDAQRRDDVRHIDRDDCGEVAPAT
ncbi:MAG: hypothetical protein M3022_12335 [Actinomycetota bacterium]|nr:hypothetical protein [Actinomycetota bacterium]